MRALWDFLESAEAKLQANWKKSISSNCPFIPYIETPTRRLIRSMNSRPQHPPAFSKLSSHSTNLLSVCGNNYTGKPKTACVLLKSSLALLPRTDGQEVVIVTCKPSLSLLALKHATHINCPSVTRKKLLRNPRTRKELSRNRRTCTRLNSVLTRDWIETQAKIKSL